MGVRVHLFNSGLGRQVVYLRTVSSTEVPAFFTQEQGEFAAMHSIEPFLLFTQWALSSANTRIAGLHFRKFREVLDVTGYLGCGRLSGEAQIFETGS